MSRIALHHWQGRIAPVFDTGGGILLLESGTGQREERQVLKPQPLHRAGELRALGVDTLICGAISRAMREAMTGSGITVLGFVAGELERVIAAWERNELDEAFAMPGCRGCGAGRQHQARRRRSCREEMEPDQEALDRRPGGEPGCARIRGSKPQETTRGRRRAWEWAGGANKDSAGG